MTTAVKEKEKPATIKEIFRGPVAIDRIAIVSNVRKNFNPELLKELIGNIAKVGVLEPILLRPLGDDYALIAGERRLRAATAAGLKEIPARALDVTEQQAAEIQAFENLHRAQLTPIEEAFAFKMLLDQAGLTVGQVAQRVDKSEAYVYRAIRLTQLPQAAIEAIEAGVITAAHGHQLARVPQEDALQWLEQAKSTTAAKLKQRLDWDAGCDLEKANFPKNKAYAGMEACTACPFNTGNQGMLFDGAEKGRCMNETCYGTKTKQAIADKVDSLKKKYPKAAFVKSNNGSIWTGQRLDSEWQVKDIVTSETKFKGEFGLVVNGPVVYLGVKLPKSTSTSSSQIAPTKRDPKAEFIEEAIKVAFLTALGEKSKKLTKKHLVELVERMIDLHSGTNEADYIQKALGFGLEPGKLSEQELTQALVVGSLMSWDGTVDGDQLEHLGVNLNAVEKAATKAAEKQWAAQEAADKKGTPAK